MLPKSVLKRASFVEVLLVLAIFPSAESKSNLLPGLLSNNLIDNSQPNSFEDNVVRRPLPISLTDDSLSLSVKSKISPNEAMDKLPIQEGSTLLVLPFQQNSLPGSWCKTKPFLHKVHHRGCKPKYVINNMCFGQCLSFFIPKHFVSCSTCLVDVKAVQAVELQCDGPRKLLVKKISIVKSCRCQPCERSKRFYLR